MVLDRILSGPSATTVGDPGLYRKQNPSFIVAADDDENTRAIFAKIDCQREFKALAMDIEPLSTKEKIVEAVNEQSRPPAESVLANHLVEQGLRHPKSYKSFTAQRAKRAPGQYQLGNSHVED